MSHRARKQNVARSALFRLTPGRPPRNSGENGRGPNGGPGRRARAVRSGSDSGQAANRGGGARRGRLWGVAASCTVPTSGTSCRPAQLPVACRRASNGPLQDVHSRPSWDRRCRHPGVRTFSPTELTEGAAAFQLPAGELGGARPWPGQGKKSLDRISRSRWGTKKEVAWARLP